MMTSLVSFWVKMLGWFFENFKEPSPILFSSRVQTSMNSLALPQGSKVKTSKPSPLLNSRNTCNGMVGTDCRQAKWQICAPACYSAIHWKVRPARYWHHIAPWRSSQLYILISVWIGMYNTDTLYSYVFHCASGSVKLMMIANQCFGPICIVQIWKYPPGQAQGPWLSHAFFVGFIFPC